MYLCDEPFSGSTWPTPKISWTKIFVRWATRPAMSSTPHWMPPPVPRTVTGRRKMNLPRIAKKRVGCFGFYIFKGGLFKGSMDPHFSGISLWQCVAKLFGKICHKIFQIKGGQFWSKSFPSVYFWCIFCIFGGIIFLFFGNKMPDNFKKGEAEKEISTRWGAEVSIPSL